MNSPRVELSIRISGGGPDYQEETITALRRELRTHAAQVSHELATTTSDFAAELEDEAHASNRSPRPRIVVVDLLPDVIHVAGTSDAKTENNLVGGTASNLRRALAALRARRSHLLVCNLFAYAPAAPVRFLRRLHEMNIMLVRLSQESDVRIAHVHTGMSETGANSLQTDYRLYGKAAGAVTAREIVSTLTEGHLLSEHLEGLA